MRIRTSIALPGRVMAGLAAAVLLAALPAGAQTVAPLFADRPPAWKPLGCRSVSPLAADALPSPAGWSNIHADAASSDSVESAAGPDFAESWTAEADTYNVSGPVFDSDNNAYFSPVAAHDGSVLISIDGETGARRWAVAATTDGIAGAAAPLLLDDPDTPGAQIVYQVVRDRAFAVRTDGTFVWDVATGLTAAPKDLLTQVIGVNYVPAHDAIVAITVDGLLLLHDRATGANLLAAPFSLPGVASPDLPAALTEAQRNAVEDLLQDFADIPDGSFQTFGNLLLGEAAEVANHVSVDPGASVIWAAATAPDAEDGNADGVSSFGALYRLEVAGGPGLRTITEACHYSYAGGSASTPSVSADGSRVYIADSAGKVIAVAAADCSEIWSVDLGRQVVGSLAIAADNGRIYASTLLNVHEIIDQGASGALGWTSSMDPAFAGLSSIIRAFNLNLVAITANGLLVQAGAGRLQGNLPLANVVGIGMLDRADGSIRSFVAGGDETVAVMSTAANGNLYIGNSPFRRAVAVALGLSSTPLRGGITRFALARPDRTVRDTACAVADRAANADANAVACPASADADAGQIAILLGQLRNQAAPAALAAGQLTAADWSALEPHVDAADAALAAWEGGDGTALGDVAAAAASACALLTDCPPTPRTSCRPAGRTALSLATGRTTRDTLKFQWAKGSATVLGDLGDPVRNADLALCVWDGNGERILAATAPSGAPAWSAARDKGFRYKNKAGSATGITAARLQVGEAGKAKAQIQGKGTALPEVSVPATFPLTVQLIDSETGTCFGAAYEASMATKNEDGRIKAKFKE